MPKGTGADAHAEEGGGGSAFARARAPRLKTTIPSICDLNLNSEGGRPGRAGWGKLHKAGPQRRRPFFSGRPARPALFPRSPRAPGAPPRPLTDTLSHAPRSDGTRESGRGGPARENLAAAPRHAGGRPCHHPPFYPGSPDSALSTQARGAAQRATSAPAHAAGGGVGGQPLNQTEPAQLG